MTTLSLTNRKFQTKRTHARRTGPGELARARELRKRGLHLRLIDAWRPWHNPQTESEIVMTSINDLFPSKYIKAADLKGRTIKAKIKKVEVEEIGQDKTKKPVIYLEDAERGWVVNKTNATRIGATHGDLIEGWVGKAVTISRQPVRSAKSE